MGAGPSTASNASVSAKGDIAVVVGASQGIGLGVARRFARAGADVWIVVRNEQKGKAVVDELKRLGAPDARYFLADLSSKDDCQRAAGEIKTAAGEGGVAYLVQTQGGPPGQHDDAPGIDPHFAVQVFSRVILAYELRHTVKRSSVAIAVAGMGAKQFDKDDITLDRFKASGGASSALGKIVTIGGRDATVLDAAWMELAKDSSPDVQYLHLFPGIVKTNVMTNTGQSAFFVWMSWVAGVLVGRTIDAYAEIPFFLTANPDGRKSVERGGMFWNDRLKKVSAAPRAGDEATRKAIWDWLLAQMAR